MRKEKNTYYKIACSQHLVFGFVVFQLKFLFYMNFGSSKTIIQLLQLKKQDGYSENLT